MIRAAIYARVSSAAQRDSHTIENQLRVLPAFVAAQGWELAGTYVDDGRSAKAGKLEQRDGFARLVRDAERRAFDVLVVADVDRLTRTDDMRERAAILGPFQAAGIRIVTPVGGELDLRTMLGELYVTLHAIVAAEENRKRAERIKAGKARAIAEGRKPAGPTPYGLAYDRATGRWSTDDAAAAIVREIFQRVAGGESCVRIATDLAVRGVPGPRASSRWDRASVYRIVRKRTAVGEWHADKRRGAAIAVPAIVTEAEWQEAQQALLRHRRRGLIRTKHVYLLEGIARCSCGAPIAIRSGQRRPRGFSPAAYVCRDRKHGGTCRAQIVKCAELDARVWAALCDELEQPELVADLAEMDRGRAADGDAARWQADADGYRAHLARLDKVERELMVRFRRGVIGEGNLDHELEQLGRERRMVRDQLATAEKAIGASLTAAARQRAACATVERLRAALPVATPELRRALLRELVHDGGVVIANGVARLDLRIERAEAEGSRGAGGEVAPVALVDQRFCRMQHGAILRIRRVA